MSRSTVVVMARWYSPARCETSLEIEQGTSPSTSATTWRSRIS